MRSVLPLLLVLLCFQTVQAATAPVPIILVKGYGPHFAQLLRYQKFLSQDGVRHVYAVDYDHKSTIPYIERQVSAQLDAILNRYPKGTSFDLITHSMGGFVGFYTAIRSKWAGNLRKYVSLAGMTQGQDSLPWVCRRGRCGRAIETLTPFMNPFLRKFFIDYEKQIEKVDKCALYSYSDRIISDPPDSGALRGSKVFEVPGAGHLDFILRRDIYRLMRSVCYGG